MRGAGIVDEGKVRSPHRANLIIDGLIRTKKRESRSGGHESTSIRCPPSSVIPLISASGKTRSCAGAGCLLAEEMREKSSSVPSCYAKNRHRGGPEGNSRLKTRDSADWPVQKRYLRGKNNTCEGCSVKKKPLEVQERQRKAIFLLELGGSARDDPVRKGRGRAFGAVLGIKEVSRSVTILPDLSWLGKFARDQSE